MIVAHSLQKLKDLIVEICEKNLENPRSECFVRGEISPVTEEELLEEQSADYVETDLGEIISKAEELLEKHPELENMDTDYYNFIEQAREEFPNVEEFLSECESEGDGKEIVCAKVLYYLANNKYDEIFEDDDIIDFYVGYVSPEVVDNIKCDETNCIVEYKGVHASPYYSPGISLDYPYIYVIKGEKLGLNLYEDGYIVKPKKVIAEIKREF